MNTPAHVFTNLVLLRRGIQRGRASPIVIGSLLPDLPMFLFYAVEKIIRSTPEKIIWSQSYFQQGWQVFFDWFNSFPVFLFILGFAWWRKFENLRLFAASALLHLLLDFPFHHGDAHRHFLPFSNWRFKSPLSYWDPNHYGTILAPLEILLVGCCFIFLYRNFAERKNRMAVSCLLGVYLAYIGFALMFWF